jgi:formamidopyrimidine-DNA glycosylase
VEKAAEVIRTIGKGRKITHVDALEDTIVYSGTTNTEFVSDFSLIIILAAL